MQIELAQVKLAAQFRWPEILTAIAGLHDRQVSVKDGKSGTDCFNCGGHNRYSFKGEMNGDWACRHCGGGDGFELVKRVNNCSFPEAINLVANYLGLKPGISIEVETLVQKRGTPEAKIKQEAFEATQRARKAKFRAQTKWASLGGFAGNAYSEHKQFSNSLKAKLRQQGNCFSTPIYNVSGELLSLQNFPGTQSPDGRFNRYFAKDASIKGGFLSWGNNTDHILIGEGIATVDAGFQLAGSTLLSVSAFMASQIPVIAAIFRELHPSSPIIILADKGEAGERYATKATEKTTNCQAVLAPDGHNDWSDYFLAGGQASPIHEKTGEIQAQWPKLKPLNTDLLPVKPITPDMLPSALSGWLQDIVERMDNAPFEYAAISAIFAASSLIGRKLSIQPKQLDDWSIVPNLWGCCVGRPSTRKSPVMNAATKPLKQLEVKARDDYRLDMKEYAAKEKLTLMATKEAEKRAAGLVRKGDMQGAEALLLDDTRDPEKPVCTRHIINDATVEKLGVLLSENPKGLLLYRDELAGWMAGMNREDRQQDRAFWLEAFNGDGSFSYDRISREDVYIPSNTVSLLGGIQPKKLLPLLVAQKNGNGDDGLVERLQLMVYPDKTSFQYADRPPNQKLKAEAYEVYRKLEAIGYAESESDKPLLKFDSEGQTCFNDWYCELMERINGDEIPPQIESHLGKYPSLMPSLAGIFHTIDNGATGTIKAHYVKMAIKWCEVLETHAQRVYALAYDPQAEAKLLAERLSKLPAEFKMDTLRDKGWTGLTTSADREKALTILEAHGFIVKVETRKSSRGRASVSYRVNPAALLE